MKVVMFETIQWQLHEARHHDEAARGSQWVLMLEPDVVGRIAFVGWLVSWLVGYIDGFIWAG